MPSIGARSKARQTRGGWATVGALLLLPAACTAGAEHATPEWSAEALLGGAFNFRTTLSIERSMQTTVRWDADYHTRGLDRPLYYAFRVARRTGDGAWGIELVHHKLYLENRLPEVQDFAVSHGYNLLMLGRSRNWLGVILWGHAGVVIAHPENTVDGRPLPESGGALGTGYYLAGAAVGGSVEKRVALGERWFAAFEAALIACSARVPVEGGHADVPNSALHVWVGIGRRRPRRMPTGHAQGFGYIRPRPSARCSGPRRRHPRERVNRL